MTRTHLPGILAMATIVVASNILVQFLYGQWLTWGAFTYPLAFLVTDVMNRLYGAAAARRVVLVGFAIAGVGTSVVYPQVYARMTKLPGISAGRGLGFMSTGMRFGVLVTPIVTGALAERIDVGTAIAIVVAVAAVILIPGIVRLLQITE